MKEIYVGGIYLHFKGNQYRVLAVSSHSETLEKMIVYQALYGQNEVWVRPYKMFFDKVDGNYIFLYVEGGRPYIIEEN